MQNSLNNLTIHEYPLKDGQYFTSKPSKSGILLHHTVGGSAKGTIDFWNSDARKIATEFVIDRNGKVYRAFPEGCWACHVGIVGDKNFLDRRTIGIELANYGPLFKKENKFFTIYGSLFKGEDIWDNIEPYRGYRYFEAYTQQQINSLINLTNYLFEKYPMIDRKVAKLLNFSYTSYREFRGVLYHHSVRMDKTDVSPAFLAYEDLFVKECQLRIDGTQTL